MRSTQRHRFSRAAWLFVSIAAVLLTRSVNCFNIDLATKIVYKGHAQSMFGYSVDLYKGSDGYWALIGAPKDETSRQQPGVEQGGQVHKCSTRSSSCSFVAFDTTGPNTALVNGSVMVQIDTKSHQWFGATVVSSRTTDNVLACAPRYMYFYSTLDRQEPVGICYLAQDSFTKFKTFAPCRNERTWGYHRLGMCMAGFSAAVPRDEDSVFLGAPGAWYWQGSLIVQSTQDEGTSQPQTLDGEEWKDDTYLGYSVASGDFDNDGRDDAIVGNPKGNDLTGRVIAYDARLKQLFEKTGEQIGSYFGASVAAADVDGDGKDDIIVGAPLYVHYKRTDRGLTSLYDVGKVYVYLQGDQGTFQQKPQSVVGDRQWARFGYAVASAGDLNGDRYQDFVVGAPYDGDDRRGAVYVFNGAEGGFREAYSQVIRASDVDRMTSTFGFSLSGNRDIDDNEYPDLVVGAYKSDRAVVFRTRPVIAIEGMIDVGGKDGAYIMLGDEEASCTLEDHVTQVICRGFKICMQYDGKNAPSQLDVDVLVQLDADKGMGNRTLFLKPEGASQKTVRLRLARDSKDRGGDCINEYIYLRKTITDKLNPIVIRANVSIFDPNPLSNVLKPTLDIIRGQTSFTAKLEIKKDCGPDNVCIPDLDVAGSVFACRASPQECRSSEEFNVGADDYLNVTVRVDNDGEDAYEAKLFVTIPAGLDFMRHTKLTDTPVTTLCTAPKEYELHDKSQPYNLTCDIGNPLPKHSTISLSFLVSVNRTLAQFVKFYISANSTNPENPKSMDNNDVTLSVRLDVRPDFVLLNSSKPDGTITYSQSDRRITAPDWDHDIGVQVQHIYQLRNEGSNPLPKIQLDIYWPMNFSQDEYLLYLSSMPVYTEGVSGQPCTLITGRIDPMRLNPNRGKSKWKRQAQQQTVKHSSFGSKFRELVDSVKRWGNRALDKALNPELRRIQVNCTDLLCVHIRCMVGPLQPNWDQLRNYAVISVDSYLWMNTVIDHAFYDAKITSVASATLLDLPYSIAVDQLPVRWASVSTTVSPKDPTKIARGVPWWLYLIAIMAGIVFLLLIAMACWKCGFFKRDRPPKTMQAVKQRPPEAEYYGFPQYGQRL